MSETPDLPESAGEESEDRTQMSFFQAGVALAFDTLDAGKYVPVGDIRITPHDELDAYIAMKDGEIFDVISTNTFDTALRAGQYVHWLANHEHEWAEQTTPERPPENEQERQGVGVQ